MGNIRVCEGDAPDAVAEAFCSKHELPGEAAAPLALSCTWDRALQIWDLSSCASFGPVSTLRLDRSPVALAMPAAWRVDGAAPASKRVPVVLGDDEGGVHFLEMWWSEAELEPGEPLPFPARV